MRCSKTIFALAAVLLAFLFACVSACVSTDSPKPPAVASGRQASDADINAVMEQAQASMDANHLAEGIRYYVAALAMAKKSGLTERATSIERILSEIAGRLSLEPHESWIGSDSAQATGLVREAGSGTGIMPAVYLYASYGYEKSPVADAAIRFVFTVNSGTLTASVRTDSRGMANTSIQSIQSLGLDATIRAYPVFEAEGYVWEASSVYRDFAYRVPPKLAVVAAMDRSPSGVSANPRLLDMAAESVKKLGMDTVPVSASLNESMFAKAFGGDAPALLALAPQSKAGYYVLVYSDVRQPNQVVLGGKTYNIYTTTGSVTLRILRADGSLLWATVRDGVSGQGGTPTDAISACQVAMRELLQKAVSDEMEKIRLALSE